ncbi:ERBB receptor feedback inhibitor 1 [Oncorhynchus tshawytscha]|nr:ERBB receptor feedback inhibitor 1 [Oncorhynchus tshawytscha]
MRLDCAWSMSTAGLTAQEICLPTDSPFLRASHCLSMAGAKPSWSHHHELDNLYFSVDAAPTEYNFQFQQQVPPSLNSERQKHSPGAQRLPSKKSRPTHLSLSSSAEPSTPSPAEDDQVVPSFQRLSVYERCSPPHTPSRGAKPLPPLPGRGDLSPDQAMDNEVEFFTSSDDSRCLVPEQCPPKPSASRYGAPSRMSFRHCGQINYAYFEGPVGQQRPQERQEQQRIQAQQRQQEQQQRLEQVEQQPLEQPLYPRQQDRAQRKLRRSHSGPAGSFNKPTSLRMPCHHRHTQGMDKPEVPPRVPIPPRPIKTADYRRWSAEVSSGAYSDEDKPPKVPPRDPLLSQGSSRTPSPKSLPSYLNGVMPPTQSFAPDPKYVRRGLQRQNSEGSPCILPVMENGMKASTTHYFLLPQRPAYLDKPYLEKFIRDMDCPAGRSRGASDPEWNCQTRRKAQVDLV